MVSAVKLGLDIGSTRGADKIEPLYTVRLIFTSQGFLICTAPYEPLVYCAIKRQEIFHHMIYPIFNSTK